MPEIRAVVDKVRSKNAGPFWLTIDIFCGGAFERVRDGLSSERVAQALGCGLDTLRRFEIPELDVIKFSCPRPVVQGTRFDRDMHGASYANLIAELEIN